MSDAVIQVQGLSKRYFISHQSTQLGGLRDGLRHRLELAVRNPFGWLKGFGKHASESLEEYWALRDVSFEVKRGEVIGIIGRNGAGKSTLLKLLSRITEPTSGRISIDGRVASLLEVGTGFHPELTGRENIFLNGAILGMGRAEIRRKFDEIVAFAEVEKFLDTPVKRYSSGMYVRLAFAVAAHLEPEILIIDEVLAVGDSQFQKKCLGKISEVAKGGRTVLFVSHSMPAVLNLCSRCVFLERGRLSADGDSKVVVSAYLNQGRSDYSFSRINATEGDKRIVINSVAVAPQPLVTGAAFTCTVLIGRPPDAIGELFAEISVDVLSEREARLVQLFSRNMGKEFSVPPGESRFCVSVPELPLAPGRYSLVAWVGYGHTTFDLVWDCYSFEVDPGCFVEGAFVENRGFPVVPRCAWSRQ